MTIGRDIWTYLSDSFEISIQMREKLLSDIGTFPHKLLLPAL
jgi:hypothetical protein